MWYLSHNSNEVNFCIRRSMGQTQKNQTFFSKKKFLDPNILRVMLNFKAKPGIYTHFENPHYLLEGYLIQRVFSVELLLVFGHRNPAGRICSRRIWNPWNQTKTIRDLLVVLPERIADPRFRVHTWEAFQLPSGLRLEFRFLREGGLVADRLRCGGFTADLRRLSLTACWRIYRLNRSLNDKEMFQIEWLKAASKPFLKTTFSDGFNVSRVSWKWRMSHYNDTKMALSFIFFTSLWIYK